MSKDDIYASREAKSGSFVFDDAVANVFPDMLRRSIPGYEATLEAIGALAARYAQADSACYDLGCSLGDAAFAVRHRVKAPNFRIVAVDLAPAMVSRCRERLAADEATVPMTVQESDVRDVEIDDASLVLLNYTLQFVPVGDRAALVKRIHDGMRRGGILVLSEKVADPDPAIEKLQVDLHLDFKRSNAYSELEISRKRSALENVLVPESVATHLQRLHDAGFRHAGVWLQHFNFVSIVAIR